MEEKNVTLLINIFRISDQGYFLNEEISLPEKSNPSIDIRFQFHTDIEQEKIGLVVEALFYNKEDPSQVLLSGRVRTDYKVVNLKSLKIRGSESIDIPDQAMISMLSIAISHLRAVLARHASGTKHHDLILPIVNPGEIYHNFKNSPVAH